MLKGFTCNVDHRRRLLLGGINGRVQIPKLVISRLLLSIIISVESLLLLFILVPWRLISRWKYCVECTKKMNFRISHIGRITRVPIGLPSLHVAHRY